MIDVKDLFAGYGKEPVLQGVNMSAKAGEITTILGANGSGKSTLLKAVGGMIPTQRGEILIAGDPALSMSRIQRARLMAYLPQSKHTPDITVGRLVLHGRFPHLSYPRIYSEKDIQIAKSVMQAMEIAQWEDTPLSELSGGMRQRVYLAMVLAQQSEIILMDEPTTYLDLGQQIKFLQLLKELAQQGKTLLLVLHDILLALKLSDRICVMDHGKIVAAGSPQEILDCRILTELYGVRIGEIETEKSTQFYYCVE